MTATIATQCLLPLPGLEDELAARPKRRRASRRTACRTAPGDTRASKPLARTETRVDIARQKSPRPASTRQTPAPPSAAPVTARRTRPAFGGVLARGRELLMDDAAPARSRPAASRPAAHRSFVRTLAAAGAALWSGIDILFLSGDVTDQPGAQQE